MRQFPLCETFVTRSGASNVGQLAPLQFVHE
jgi:hypothetical protein